MLRGYWVGFNLGVRFRTLGLKVSIWFGVKIGFVFEIRIRVMGESYSSEG